MENVVARYRQVMRESLLLTLCVDALGGQLARRWGALLRHLRLPRLGHPGLAHRFRRLALSYERRADVH